MIEQYIKYGLIIILPIILIAVIPPILKRFMEALEKLSRIELDMNNLLKLIVSFGLILVCIAFFVMLGASLIRITLLSDEVDSGIIYLMLIVLVAYLSTLVAFLLLIREIYRGEHREIKKESFPQRGEN